MHYKILTGDALEQLATLPDGSARCCVTSPPYYGLRDYGHDRQIGLEATPDDYVARMVAVFREVRRVLTDDGTVWINLGDSYGQKQLQGMPWRVAFALQSDGWYLRQDIIWHKPNPMPESVTDRCTKAHEYVFLLSKSARYFWDASAMQEASFGRWNAAKSTLAANGEKNIHLNKTGQRRTAGADTFHRDEERTGRNRRSVWTVTTKPYSGAHFAVMPPELVEPCILAGSAPGDTVLDPFTGSGTTGAVALAHGRSFVGTELNPAYVALAHARIRNVMPLFVSEG
jgi:DNA modification methylase